MKQLIVARDNRATPVYALEMTDSGWTASLAADTDTTVAVPDEARFAIIAGDDHYFVSLSAISLPTPAGGFSAQNAEQDKQIVFFELPHSSLSLHFRARNATDISVSFWR